MRNLLLIIVFFLTYTASASDKPAKIDIKCSEVNDCSIALTLSDGWKMYVHDENNPESLNFTLNGEESRNIESIEINWDAQKIHSEEILGMKIEYYNSGSTIPFKIFTKDDRYRLYLDVQYAACNNYCTVFRDKVSLDGENTLGHETVMRILILAFLGGFILNCMPCVLPIVWLKVMHISRKCKANIRKTRIEIFYISLGIITSFLLLAIITALMRSLGHGVGWGMQFQEPLFISLLAIVTGIGAMNMLGMISFNPPQFLQNILDKSDGKISDFLHGVFIVLLATPCTAPFLGTAIAFCLTQPAEYIFIVYLSVAIGLATPYLILAIFPGTLKLLPKPGKWMEKFKFIAALPFAGTSLWMLNVLTSQNLILAIMIFLMIFILIARYSFKISFVTLIIFGIISVNGIKNTEKVRWEKFRIDRISDEVKLGKTVLVNITSDWCITCKVNERMVFSNESILSQLKEKGVVMIIGDYTSNSKPITDYIKKNNRSGIPLSIVYGPAAPDGIVLPVVFTKKDLIDAIDKARKM